MVQRTKNILWSMLIYSSKFVGGMVAIGIIISTIWAFTKNEVETYARDLVGYPEISTALDNQSDAIKNLDTRVASIENRIALFHPIKVAEYDELRSYIVGNKCSIGSICQYVYRVRRTEDGVACSAPTYEQVLIDSSGLTYFPKKNQSYRPIKLTREWSIISASFIVPEGVNKGIAEFYLKLTYSNCEINNNVIDSIDEYSFKLVFKIE